MTLKKRLMAGEVSAALLASTRTVAGGIAATIALVITGIASASAETRSLNIYHTHTQEHEVIVFKRDGAYDSEGLKQLNHILRDWRRNEAVRMDPALFDLIYEVYRDTGASGPIQVVCGYRSPSTNNMLRSRSRGVAKFSQHTLGKAMDFYLSGVPLERLREVGMKKQVGGVGFYPTSGSPFVHLDTGGVRAWPRMTHDQLVRLFPDGKTIHLPSDGGPLPRYQEALADYQRRGGTQTQVAGIGQPQDGAAPVRAPASGNVFAALFGAKPAEEDEEETAPTPVAVTRKPTNQTPLPAAQPAKPVVASNQPRLMTKPADEDAGPVAEAPQKPVILATLPPPPASGRPQITPAPVQVAMQLPQPAAAAPPQLVPVRAPGAILPTGWTTGPSGTPTQQTPSAAAALKSVDVPVPVAKPQAVVGAVPRPRPSVPQSAVVASNGPRPIEDAFSALTGTPRDPGSSALLGYAPVTAPIGPQEPRTMTSVARDTSSKLRLASLGTSDAINALPTDGNRPSALSQAVSATLAKANRGDPMARLVSHVTDELAPKFLDPARNQRAPAMTQLIHPDQDTMPQMIVKPTQVLAYTFNRAPMQLSTERFAGPAVVALAVIEMP